MIENTSMQKWGTNTMSIIQELITDRTEADRIRVRELKQKILKGKGVSALTAEEQTEYFGNPKGAYNYTDLNRVGNAVTEVASLYHDGGYSVSVNPKNDWVVSDIPTPEQMQTYLGDVEAIRTVAELSLPLPYTMDRLTPEGANQIERVLIEAYDAGLKMTRDWLFSGEFDAGDGIT